MTMKAFGLDRIEAVSFPQVDDLPCILPNRSCKDNTVFVNANSIYCHCLYI